MDTLKNAVGLGDDKMPKEAAQKLKAQMKEGEIKRLNNGQVYKLENGELSLDEALSKYEEGVKLVRLCQKKLQEAKKKIEILVKTKEGKIKLEPFEEPAEKRQKSEKQQHVKAQ